MGLNSTDKDVWQSSQSDKTLITVIFGILLVTGIVGNVLVIALILLVRKMRSAVNLCLASLALADLMVLIFLPILPLSHLYNWDESFIGTNFCVFLMSIDRGAMVCSILTFLLVGVERYTVLCRPLETLGLWTRPKVGVILAVIWIVSAGISVPFGYATMYGPVRLNNITTVSCRVLWDIPWINWYDLGVLCVGFYLPIPVLMVLYGKIAITLKRGMPQNDTQGNGTRGVQRARTQVITMLMSVVIVFVICLLPFQIYLLFYTVAADTVYSWGDEINFIVLWITRTMLYINHVINPIIYMAMSANFREAFVTCFCKCRNRRQDNVKGSWMTKSSRVQATEPMQGETQTIVRC